MICLIAAVSKNRVIGKNGHIPWKLKEDLVHFKKLTTGNVLIMGRKTFEEIGKPLENRFTVVISAKKNAGAFGNAMGLENTKVVRSFEEALIFAKKITEEIVDLPQTENFLNPFFNRDVFICGGSSVYQKAMPFVQKMYLTEIHAEFDGDVFFPQFDEAAFEKIVEKSDEKNPVLPYDFVTYSRK